MINDPSSTRIRKEYYIVGLFMLLLITTSIVIDQHEMTNMNEMLSFMLSFVIAIVTTYLICYMTYRYRLYSTHRGIITLCRQLGGNIHQKNLNDNLAEIVIDNWACQLSFKVTKNNSLSLYLNSVYRDRGSVVTLPIVGDQSKGLAHIREIIRSQRWVLIAEALKHNKFYSHLYEKELAYYRLQDARPNGLIKMQSMTEKLNPVFFIRNADIDITVGCIPPLSLANANDATIRFLGECNIDLDQATLLVYKAGEFRGRHQIRYEQFTPEQLLVLILTTDEFESLNVYQF